MADSFNLIDKHLYLSLNDSLTIIIKNEKLGLYPQTEFEYIENKWTYKLTGDFTYQEDGFDFEMLETFVSSSSIVTFYSSNNISYDSLASVTIKSLYFDWDCLDDEIFTRSDSIVIKFIALVIMQVIDFFTKGYDSGRLQQNSNNSKLVILDKKINILTHNDTNTINVLKRISFLPTLSNPNMTLFKIRINSEVNEYYASEETVTTVISAQDYIKVICI